VALDTPAALKAMLGGDVITLRTSDNALARTEITERWGLPVVETGGELRLEVERGDEFVPELVRAITPRVEAIGVSRPTLDDVFIKVTGRGIREQEASAVDPMRQMGRMWTSTRR
jgi:ABC-2 type transport system ATP-binding protein